VGCFCIPTRPTFTATYRGFFHNLSAWVCARRVSTRLPPIPEILQTELVLTRPVELAAEARQYFVNREAKGSDPGTA
jgi:hypothetical protein